MDQNWFYLIESVSLNSHLSLKIDQLENLSLYNWLLVSLKIRQSKINWYENWSDGKSVALEIYQLKNSSV